MLENEWVLAPADYNYIKENARLVVPNGSKSKYIADAYKDMVGKDTNFLDNPLVSNYSKISWSSKVPSGTWSDDTSLIVASMATIVKDEGIINYDHILDAFLNWWEKGEYCAIDNFSFGLGRSTSAALDKFNSGVPALDCGGDGIKDNGNGSLMRILPFSLYAISMEYDEEQSRKMLENVFHGMITARKGKFGDSCQ